MIVLACDYIDFEPFEVPRTYPRERSKYAVTNKKCMLLINMYINKSVIIINCYSVWDTPIKSTKNKPTIY